MAAPSATAIRNGLPETVTTSQLVRGDVVILEAGNIVPADMRLMNQRSFKVERLH